MKKSSCSLIASALFTFGAGNGLAATIATWTFESTPPSSTGSAITGILADVGTGIASGFHASASTVYSNPVGNGSTESFSSNNWGPGDYYQFQVSTVDFEDILVNWDQTRSSTGPSAFELQYSTNGTDFATFSSITVNAVSWSSSLPAEGASFSADLSAVPAVEGVALLTFRLTQTASDIATGGTNRVDNFSVSTVPEAGSAMLGLLGCAVLLSRRRR